MDKSIRLVQDSNSAYLKSQKLLDIGNKLLKDVKVVKRGRKI